MRRGEWFEVACAVLFLVGANAPSARAQCAYTSLSSGTTVSTSMSPQTLSFNQAQNFYTAVGVRPPAGANWDLTLYQSQGPSPQCVATPLASSTRSSGVDFVIGDFNAGHDAVGLYYPQVTQVLGAGNATVEWDGGANSLTVNGPLVSRTTGSSDVLECWDVSLTAGNLYTFTFNPSGAALKLLLFKSGAGTYWAGRDTRIFEATGTTTFTPSTSGFYGVVVVNDDGAVGSYTVGVGRCDTPTALTSGTVASSSLAERYYSINQPTDFFWTAVGVRGSSDWNLEVYGTSGGGSYPVCFSGALAGSAQSAPTVDFVVANFSVADLVPPYFVRTHLNNDTGSGAGAVEWDDGGTLSDIVEPEAQPPTPAVTRATGPNDVLECWDMYLTQGQSYRLFLGSTGPAVKAFLFSPTLGWGNRANAILTLSPGTSAVPYVATATGYHGLVIVNEDGAAGTYEFRAYIAGALAVDGAIPSRTSFTGVEPNPAHGSARIRFALRQPGSVGFDVIDAAGRRVASVPDRPWSAGQWSVTWNGRDANGGRLAPGVYFVRMFLDRQVLGLRKVALLD